MTTRDDVIEAAKRRWPDAAAHALTESSPYILFVSGPRADSVQVWKGVTLDALLEKINADN